MVRKNSEAQSIHVSNGDEKVSRKTVRIPLG